MIHAAHRSSLARSLGPFRLVIATSLALLILVLAGARPAAAGMDGFSLYLLDTINDKLFRVDPDTGMSAEVGDLGIDAGQCGIDVAPDGTLWAFTRLAPDEHALLTIDASTGEAALVQTFDTTGLAQNVGFAFGPDGETPYWRSNNGIFELDVDDGTVSLVLADPVLSDNLTLACGGLFFRENTVNRLFHYDIDTASLTPGPFIVGGASGNNLTSARDGRLFSRVADELFVIDEVTGLAEFVGGPVPDGCGLTIGPRDPAKHRLPKSPTSPCSAPFID